jgi:hypothetical protein
VFALIKAVPDAEEIHFKSETPLWQFFLAGGGYSESMFLSQRLKPHSKAAMAKMKTRQPW